MRRETERPAYGTSRKSDHVGGRRINLTGDLATNLVGDPRTTTLIHLASGVHAVIM